MSARSCGSGLGSKMTSQSASSCRRLRKPATRPRQLLVGHAETLTVAVLEIDALPQAGIDLIQMQRVDRKPPLVLLLRPRQRPETEQIHARSPDRVLVCHHRECRAGGSHSDTTGKQLSAPPILRSAGALRTAQGRLQRRNPPAGESGRLDAVAL